MTDAEYLKTGRIKLGLTMEQMGEALHLRGKYVRNQVWKMENGKANISREKMELLKAYLAGYRPDDWPGKR